MKNANKTSHMAKPNSRLKKHLPFIIMMIPGLAYLFIYNYIPKTRYQWFG